MKITSISQEKMAELFEYREKVFREATTPGLDFETTKTQLGKIYGFIGQKEPIVVSVPSPLAAQYLIHAFTLLQAEGKEDKKNKLAEVGRFGPDILGQIAAIAGKRIASKAKKNFTLTYPSIDADSWWRGWSAFYVFCGTLPLDKPYTDDSREKLDVIDKLCSSAGWIWTFEGLAIVSERPTSKWSDDETPVLHCPDGPSVSFRDGFELYHWRGTRVPKEWVLDRATIKPEFALNHPNMEQRRCAAEMLDWNIFDARMMNMIDEDPDPEIGILFEAEIAGFKEKFLRVQCGTGRFFTYPVPPEVKTALEAQSKIWDVPEDVYLALEVRT